MRCLVGGGLLPALAVVGSCASQAGTGPPSWHHFSGVDVTDRSAFVHHGVVWAMRDSLHEPGWRLRGLANAGTHRYHAGGIGIEGRALGMELMPGYTWFNEHRGLSLYLGLELADHRTRPDDPGRSLKGTHLGASVLVEGWTRLSDTLTLDLSAGFSTVADDYSVRLAASVELTDRLTVEPEFVAFGEPGYDQQRLGLLVQLHRTPALQVLAGGGLSHDPDGIGGYFTVQLKRWH